MATHNGCYHGPARLTAKELQVMRLLRGDDGTVVPDKELAERMGTSIRAAKYHLYNIRKKIGVGSKHRIFAPESLHNIGDKEAGNIVVSKAEMRFLDEMADSQGFAHSNKEIAATLGISERTSKDYISRLARRFNAKNRYALANAYARMKAQVMVTECQPESVKLSAADRVILKIEDPNEIAFRDALRRKMEMPELMLTPMELMAVRMLPGDHGSAVSNMELAERMGVSVRTAKFHVFNSMAKMNVHGRQRMARIVSDIGVQNVAGDESKETVRINIKEMRFLDAMTDDVGFALRNNEIAAKLGIPERTSRYYISTLNYRFNVKNRYALANAYARMKAEGRISITDEAAVRVVVTNQEVVRSLRSHCAATGTHRNEVVERALSDYLRKQQNAPAAEAKT